LKRDHGDREDQRDLTPSPAASWTFSLETDHTDSADRIIRKASGIDPRKSVRSVFPKKSKPDWRSDAVIDLILAIH
jgi:hypothetical protein